MHTSVVVDVQCGNRTSRDISRGGGADSCNHAAVVIGIRMDIKEVGTSQHGNCGHHLKGAPLTDVHNALQHIYCLAHPACQNHQSRWYGQIMISFLDGPELIIVAVVVLVLFGGAQLPKLARNIGQAQKEFKKGLADGAAEGSETDKK
jgi:sec-independent protein translocase protein TatA